VRLSSLIPSTHKLNREVHLSDLIRAHVGNGDFHPEDPSKIHWAKFNMMGKFIHLVKQHQLRCRNAEDGYSFEERSELRGILNVAVMDSEVSLCLCPMFRMITCVPEDATITNRTPIGGRRIQ
jgi:hypothetical protein